MTTNTIEARARRAAIAINKALAQANDGDTKLFRVKTLERIITAEMAGADEVESALAALRKHLGPYPQLIVSVRDCGKETRTVRGTKLEYGIQIGMNGQEYDADSLAAALDAAMNGEVRENG